MPFASPYLFSQEFCDVSCLIKDLQKLFDTMVGNYFAVDEDEDKQTNFSEGIHNACIAVEGIIDAYSEAYVDAMAFSFLKCKTWEYLSTFLYENEDPISYVLSPITLHVTMRIGAILSVCDPTVESCLQKETDQEFTEQCDVLQAKWVSDIIKYGLWNSYDDQVDEKAVLTRNVKLYVAHIGKILREYRDVYRTHKIAQPLEEYLRICIKEQEKKYEAEEINNARNEICDLFHAGMVVSQDDKEANIAWNLLLKYWMDSSQCTKEEDIFE